MTAQEIIRYMESLRNEAQRQVLMGFFKTAPGEYGYGDEFLGIKVPQTREVVKMAAKDTPLSEIHELLRCRWHEVRLCGLLMLVWHFERLATKRLANDAAAIRKRDELPSALGDKEYKINVLDELAASSCLWKQRMSIVCTWKTSQLGDASWCLRYAEVHLHHPHDLMHKAVGWMLREMGKRVSMDLLRDFLHQHVREMPRTALRYAIEKMDDEERQYWMNIPNK